MLPLFVLQSSTVAAALALALAASSVSALTPKLLGNFSVTNPSFLLLDNFGSGPVNLVCAWRAAAA
jgi:hypothetical protein